MQKQSNKVVIIKQIFNTLNDIEHSLDAVISMGEKHLQPIIKFGFIRIVKLLSPFVPIQNADLIIGVSFRVFLILPIMWLLKKNFNLFACFFLLYHEFLSSAILTDDPKNKLFNSFYEICFVKIENMFNLLVIMQFLDFSNASYFTPVFYCLFYYPLIFYDSLLAIISVKNYFEAMTKFDKLFKIIEIKSKKKEKLKKKLESFGIVMLCLSFEPSTNPFNIAFELTSFIFLILVVKMANDILFQHDVKEANLNGMCINNGELLPSISRPLDVRADRVYTIGCFDLLHYGHIRLFERMRSFGKKVIVGVHDSRSIYIIKNRVPVDSTETRMLNVKKYADQVFCVAAKNPTNYIKCIVSLDPNETAIYVRGEDRPNFGGREIVEKLMLLIFLPYTEGISSTEIRKQKYSHIKADDKKYLEMIN